MGQRQVFQCDSGGELWTDVTPPSNWNPITVAYFDRGTNTARTVTLFICDECWNTSAEVPVSTMLSDDPSRQALMDDLLRAELQRGAVKLPKPDDMRKYNYPTSTEDPK